MEEKYENHKIDVMYYFSLCHSNPGRNLGDRGAGVCSAGRGTWFNTEYKGGQYGRKIVALSSCNNSAGIVNQVFWSFHSSSTVSGLSLDFIFKFRPFSLFD
jgi:hypothetical protein